MRLAPPRTDLRQKLRPATVRARPAWRDPWGAVDAPENRMPLCTGGRIGRKRDCGLGILGTRTPPASTRDNSPPRRRSWPLQHSPGMDNPSSVQSFPAPLKGVGSAWPRRRDSAVATVYVPRVYIFTRFCPKEHIYFGGIADRLARRGSRLRGWGILRRASQIVRTEFVKRKIDDELFREQAANREQAESH